MRIRTITTALALSLTTVLMADEPAPAPAKPVVDRSVKSASGEVLFARYDTNKDGKVTPQEFKGGKTFFNAYDANKDGVLTMDEIKAAEKVETAPNFRELDTDKDGYVTRREWQGTQEEFDAVDLDHDGVWSKLDRALEKHRTHAKGEIEKLDTDHDGLVSAAEWAAAKRDEGIFRRRDLNRNGSLDLDELATPLKSQK